MIEEMHEKVRILKAILQRYNRAVIAFSGGVDSTFLARMAKDVYGDGLLLITAKSSTYPEYELEEAMNLAHFLEISHEIIESEELNIPGYSENPPDRCYYCKSELFGKLGQIALEKGFGIVFDGSNADDMSDFRPGMRAKKEHGVISPLAEAGLTKDEIRHLSEELGLPTARKQSYACLASRFPYGEKITRLKLDRVAIAEFDVRQLGFSQFRIRSHGNLARLEFLTAEMNNAWLQKDRLTAICRNAGFSYITIDLSGYRTGSMNEVLPDDLKKTWQGKVSNSF